MNPTFLQRALIATLLAPALAWAFNSGSTGTDGDFSPTVNTEVQLPPSGVFNFGSVNIPMGVTVTFKKNAANTPVTILASGNVSIAGTLSVSGGKGTDVGAAGDGVLGDDGLAGRGGPGGFDGGPGGLIGATPETRNGGGGLGPGGGGGGSRTTISSYTFYEAGGGGGFGATTTDTNCSALPGNAYGSSLLLPFIGGSGGGGGVGGSNFLGGGGGGGAGGILIAATGTINLTGTVTANGGNGGSTAGEGRGVAGGGGSGGAIRLIATTLSGNGTISATSGAGGSGSSGSTSGYNVCGTGTASYSVTGSNGSVGRIRLEAETFTRTAATTPSASIGVPGALFVSGLPGLVITSVAGVAAPAAPTGVADITLPANTANPVTVTFTTTGVPVGNTVKLTVTPQYGQTSSAISPALTGTTESATASVQITLPAGPSTLQAQTTYTIVAALGDALSTYANNERVEKITLTAALGKPGTVTLITISGKEFEVPAAVLAQAQEKLRG